MLDTLALRGASNVRLRSTRRDTTSSWPSGEPRSTTPNPAPMARRATSCARRRHRERGALRPAHVVQRL